MKGFLFIIIFFSFSASKYLVEYSKREIFEEMMGKAHCITPGCNNIYKDKNSFSIHESLEDALKFINSLESDRFIALHQMTLIPTKRVTTGLEKRVVQEPRTVLVDRMEWVVNE